uniref:Uncharacterized protein n=1 Tax=Arundo donax TaxID=35708 RepID=A0A0A9CUR7_ARUDO
MELGKRAETLQCGHTCYQTQASAYSSQKRSNCRKLTSTQVISDPRNQIVHQPTQVYSPQNGVRHSE